jgi:hypothetical protein
VGSLLGWGLSTGGACCPKLYVGCVLWAIESCGHLSATKHSIGQLFGDGSSAKLVHAVKKFMWAPFNGRFNHVGSFLKQIDHVGAFPKFFNGVFGIADARRLIQLLGSFERKF